MLRETGLPRVPDLDCRSPTFVLPRLFSSFQRQSSHLYSPVWRYPSGHSDRLKSLDGSAEARRWSGRRRVGPVATASVERQRASRPIRWHPHSS